MEGGIPGGKGTSDMRTIITVAALAATIISGPALARPHHAHATAAQAGGAAARAYGAVSPARGAGAHPYGQSFEAGDYKYCMKTDGSPGCMYNSMEQCMEDRAGRGGFCYER
jgi:hypothetical protein